MGHFHSNMPLNIRIADKLFCKFVWSMIHQFES